MQVKQFCFEEISVFSMWVSCKSSQVKMVTLNVLQVLYVLRDVVYCDNREDANCWSVNDQAAL